jgi:hypothetical protein
VILTAGVRGNGMRGEENTSAGICHGGKGLTRFTYGVFFGDYIQEALNTRCWSPNYHTTCLKGMVTQTECREPYLRTLEVLTLELFTDLSPDHLTGMVSHRTCYAFT